MEFKQHVFLSDVHVGAFPDPINSRTEHNLISLIKHCITHKYALYILGDLFDYWMEYPKQNYTPQLGKKVLDTFEEYNTQVKPAVFITGNHDNWTIGHFADRGFDVEENLRIIELNGKKALLMHGDGVEHSEINFPRKLSHRILRNKQFVKFYQLFLPPKTGLNVMKWFSSQTRKKNIHDPIPLNHQAVKLIKEHNLEYVLCGHDHIPRMETFSAGTYINTGAFFKHQTVAVYNKERFQLVTWQANSQKFLPFD